MSDVFGSLVKQWSLNQTAAQADWLIGAEILTPGIDRDALRSMKAPGTAYNNQHMGKDPQPDHMDKFVRLPKSKDHGGVHINSGIPNKAFYLTAMAIGGRAWDAPGHIWYEALKASNVATNFQQFANKSYTAAGILYGDAEQRAVVSAWREVGIRVDIASAAPARLAAAGNGARKLREEDSLAALTRRLEEVAVLVAALSKDVEAVRDGK
jgi:Zn-dependent metalloprotease